DYSNGIEPSSCSARHDKLSRIRTRRSNFSAPQSVTCERPRPNRRRHKRRRRGARSQEPEASSLSFWLLATGSWLLVSSTIFPSHDLSSPSAHHQEVRRHRRVGRYRPEDQRGRAFLSAWPQRVREEHSVAADCGSA